MDSEAGLLETAPACDVNDDRGELAIGAVDRATNLYSVDPVDRDHDAVIRIGGRAPGRRVHSCTRREGHCPASAHRHLGSLSADRCYADGSQKLSVTPVVMPPAAA